MTDLTGRRDLTEILHAHLAAAADPTVLEGQVESVVAAAARRRQRPAWLASLRSHSMTTPIRAFGRPLSSAAWTAILILTLLLAVAVGAITIGGWRPMPPASIVNGPIIFWQQHPMLDDMVLYAVRPDGAGLHQLLRGNVSCPQFSPDGRRITIGFGVVNSDGTGARDFPSTVAGVSLGCSSWSSDGRTLAVEGYNDQDPSKSGIYLADAVDGRVITKLTTAGEHFSDTPYGWSPDGSQIAYMHGDVGPVAPTLRVVQVATGITQQVLPELLYPGAAWSPDGNWIVVASTGDSRFIFVRPDGSEKHSLTVPASAAFLSFPRFSPDGTRLVFRMTLTGQTNPDIYTMKIDGTDLVQITNTPNDVEYSPDWGVDPR
jgi:Tol biopolymer transport system component